MRCAVCGAENESSAAFCYRCGSSLKSDAPATGATVSLGRGDTPPFGTPAAEDAAHEPSARVYDVPAEPATAAEQPSWAPGPAATPAYMPPGASGPTSYTPTYTTTTAQQSNTALTAMILGIASIVLFLVLFCVVFTSPLSVVLGIPAVYFGRKARAEIRASGGQLTGDGMALAGIVLGGVDIALSALMLCAIVGFILFAIGA